MIPQLASSPRSRLILVPKPAPPKIQWPVAILWCLILVFVAAEIGFAMYGFVHFCMIVADKLVRLIP